MSSSKADITRKRKRNAKESSNNGPTKSPFDSIMVRSKHNVIGQSTKGKVRKNSVKKSIDSRKDSLLAEFNDKFKTNIFKDRRFGENRGDLSSLIDQGTHEQRALERFKREKLRSMKRKEATSEGVEHTLTHRGRAAVHSDDDNDVPVHQLTTQDIHKEIIMKSKLRKIEDKERKEQQLNLLEELNVGYSSIQSLLEKKDYATQNVANIDDRDAEMDEFIKEVKKLAGSVKAPALHKLKKGAEVAAEAKRELEEQEERLCEEIREKLEKMNNDKSDDDDTITHIPGTLHYVYNCFTTYDEMVNVLSEFENDLVSQETIFERILICSHPGLHQDNHEKISILLFLLYEHANKLCLTYQENIDNKDMYILLQLKLEMIQRTLFMINQILPESTIHLTHTKLRSLYRRLFGGLDIDENDNDDDDNTVYGHLTSFDLFFLETTLVLFPIGAVTNQQHHTIITPLLLLLSQIASRLPITCKKDIAANIFCVSILTSAIEESKQFIPELFGSLQSLMAHMYQSKEQIFKHYRKEAIQWKFATESVRVYCNDILNNNEICNNIVDLKVRSYPFACFFYDTDHEFFSSDWFEQSTLFCTLRIIETLFRVYRTIPSFIELFQPFSMMLRVMKNNMKAQAMVNEENKNENKNDDDDDDDDNDDDNITVMNLSDILTSLLDRIESELSSQLNTRVPLFHEIKAKPMQSLEPSYDLNYFATKRRDNELRDLGRKLKREKRGAMHELRKDTEFIGRAKLREEQIAEKAKIKKRGEIQNLLQEQQRNSNIVLGVTHAKRLGKKDRRAKNTKRSFGKAPKK